MIVHIVLFQFKDNSPEKVAFAHNILAELPAKIEQIRQFDLGDNVVESDRNFDMALYSKFESLDDLKAYQQHPEHLAVVGQMAPNLEQTVVVDYLA